MLVIHLPYFESKHAMEGWLKADKETRRALSTATVFLDDVSAVEDIEGSAGCYLRMKSGKVYAIPAGRQALLNAFSQVLNKAHIQAELTAPMTEMPPVPKIVRADG